MITPGPTGLRALPLALRLLADPRPVLIEWTRRCGPVWQTRMPGARGLVPLYFMMGPAANERILAPPYREDFTWYEGYGFTMEAMFGRDILFLLDDTAEAPAHRARHRLLVPVFHPRLDQDYAAVMRGIAERRMAGWPVAGEIDLGAEIKRLTFHIVVRLLFGAAEEDLQRLYHLFEDLGLGLFTPLRLPLPLTRYRRGLRARQALGAYLHERVRRLRAGGAVPDNMLGRLLLPGSPGHEEVAALPDETLVGEMLAFLFAGYDTTASMLTSFFVALGGRPEVAAEITREVRALPGDTLAALQEQPWLEASLLETERLYPPLTFALRGVRRGFTFAGHDIAAGSRVAYSAYYTGRMPEVFPRAEDFLPERFLDGRRPPPYTLLGFGGGHRACIGKRFAGLEMRLLIALILQRYDLHPVPGQSDAVFFNPTLQRRHGYRVQVRRP